MLNFNVVKAEFIKLQRDNFMSKMQIFSLLFWPILSFSTAWYSYKPFDLNSATLYTMNTETNLFQFLIIGFMGWMTFSSLVQSAWQMSYERESGTLEAIFITPASIMSVMFGRALGSLFSNIWMFFIFCFSLIFISGEISIQYIMRLPIAFMIIFSTALCWGVVMNVLFLFTRQSSFFFDLFDEPMYLFSGVKIEFSTFPIWAKIIGIIFPLTHSLVASRSVIYGTFNIYQCTSVLITMLILILISKILLHAALISLRRNGTYSFY